MSHAVRTYIFKNAVDTSDKELTDEKVAKDYLKPYSNFTVKRFRITVGVNNGDTFYFQLVAMKKDELKFTILKMKGYFNGFSI